MLGECEHKRNKRALWLVGGSACPDVWVQFLVAFQTCKSVTSLAQKGTIIYEDLQGLVNPGKLMPRGVIVWLYKEKAIPYVMYLCRCNQSLQYAM